VKSNTVSYNILHNNSDKGASKQTDKPVGDVARDAASFAA